MVPSLRTAVAKRIGLVAKMNTKFAEASGDLTDVQQRFLDMVLTILRAGFPWGLLLNLSQTLPRLQKALSKSVTDLEEVHSELSQAYSSGVVEGFAKTYLC